MWVKVNKACPSISLTCTAVRCNIRQVLIDTVTHLRDNHTPYHCLHLSSAELTTRAL